MDDERSAGNREPGGERLPQGRRGETGRRLWLETAVFLFLICPSIVLPYFTQKRTGLGAASSSPPWALC
jgi:hypothetical protein